MNLKNVKLVVCDMDGTLLNTEHEISEEFLVLYQSMRTNGIEFCAASGRQYQSIVDKLPSIADEIWIAAENGAVVRKGGETYLETPLYRQDVSLILDTIAGHDHIHPIVCTADQAFVSDRSSDFVSFMSEFYTSHRMVDDLRQYEGESLKVALYNEINSKEFIYPVLKHLEPALKVKVSGLYWVDVSAPSAHKGNAIELVQKAVGVDKSQTMVFGDYHNDLEMLALGDFSYAMGNAHPDIKAVAKYETLSNAELGVESVLRKLLG